jgi:acetyl esterase/lipase
VARTAPTHSRSAAKRNRIRERWAQRGFSPNDLLNLWKPNGAWEQYRGLAYGERPRQKLDVYRPRHAAKAPILLFFYGGSWQRGSRDLYPFVGTSLAAQGIVTVVPDYSIFPPARFPMFVEDAARAVRFARDRAGQWGGDPSRLVLMGHSAGAYIAAMLSFDPQWLEQVGLNSQTDLAGFIGLAGPYDFLPIESRTLRTIFGGANRVETQPISFATGKEAPSLLITARRDRLVNPDNSRRMAAKIRGKDISRGRSSHADRRFCAWSASSSAGSARRHSIRLARYKQAGRFCQQPIRIRYGRATKPVALVADAIGKRRRVFHNLSISEPTIAGLPCAR